MNVPEEYQADIQNQKRGKIPRFFYLRPGLSW